MKEVRSERSLTSKAYEAVRAAVVSGELVAGQLYSVHDLAETLNVSRTPVREALIKLASQGMVAFERNRGVRILRTSASDLEEIFELRCLLEVPATRLAAARLSASDVTTLRRCLDDMAKAADAGNEKRLMEHDRRFHTVILEASGNHRLAVFVDGLRDLVLTRGVSTARSSRSLQDITQEHVPILERIEAKDGHGAAELMRTHLLHTARLLLLQEFGADSGVIEAWADQVNTALRA